MATSTQFAGTGGVSTTEPPSADNTWRDAGNITADDGSAAATQGVTFDALRSSNSPTYFLVASNFGHTLTGATSIDGIEVKLDIQTAGSNVQDYIIKVSGNSVGLSDNRADLAEWTTSTVETYGSSTDKWFASDPGWSVSEIEATDFTVYISATGTNDLNFLSTNIDYVETVIHYSTGGGGGGGGTNAKIMFGSQEVKNVYMGDQIITDVYFGSNVT